LAAFLAVVILAGCGGSSASEPAGEWQSVHGPGFRFDAPAGWKVERAKSRVSATHDAELVQVATFPLLRRYDAKLFGRVARELRTRMVQRAGGIRSHAYDVTVGDQVDEYTFVLHGKREYLLLCRRTSDEKAPACDRLASSFERA